MATKKMTKSLSKVLKFYRVLLSDMHIRMTDEVYDRITELYPNDIATENYMRTYICREIDKDIEKKKKELLIKKGDRIR